MQAAENPYRFNVKTIASDPAVQRMLKRRTLAAETRKNYIKGIRFFCEGFNRTPSELVLHFKELTPDQTVDTFADVFAWAKDKIAPKSGWTWLGGVRALLLENGIREIDRSGREISKEFRRKFGSAKPLLRRDVLTKEEIVRVMKVAGKRERAIIALMASSGLRVSACLQLQIRHFKDDIWNIELPCYQLEIPESLSKEGDPYLTFASAEAVEYIRELLLERTMETTAETYIFVTRANTPLSPKRFGNLWRKLCRKAGLDMRPVQIKGFQPVGKKGGGTKLMTDAVRFNTRVHSMRKFFKTACSIAGTDRMASEAMLGHSLSSFGIESIYDYATTRKKWLRQEYLKVIRNVTFLKALPVLQVANGKARSKIADLEENVANLSQQVATLQEMFITREDPYTRKLRRLGLSIEFSTLKIESVDVQQRTITALDIDGFAKSKPGEKQTSFIREYVYKDKRLESNLKKGLEIRVLHDGDLILKIV